ncbi:MAG: hypothetical protein A3J35_04190 [Gammaproteobacteria bacterium RIFCSPLOWO2_02_FULL_52_10]|nr:MAG: hypothetical protein A3J35_04190 [Gammaproteobacteria bacterium RIFCSPLOWO2_02_FULL_52_10]
MPLFIIFPLADSTTGFASHPKRESNPLGQPLSYEVHIIRASAAVPVQGAAFDQCTEVLLERVTTGAGNTPIYTQFGRPTDQHANGSLFAAPAVNKYDNHRILCGE